MSMQEIPIDELIKKIGSIYKLAVLAARRAVELADGAAKLVDASSDARVAQIALKEIIEGKISYKEKA